MGSKKAPKPAKEQLDLTKAQTAATYEGMDFAKKQYADMMALQQQLMQRGDDEFAWQRGLAEEARARQAKYDQLFDETAGKQTRRFSEEADAYDTPARREQLAGQAVADVEAGADQARGALARGLAARGWTGGYDLASIMADQTLDVGLARASAANMAREAARREGLQLRATAAGLGSPFGSLSANAGAQASGFGLAGLQAGNAGFDAMGQAGASRNAAMGAAQGWGSQAQSGWNSIAQQNAARAASSGGFGSFLGSVVGTGLGAFAGGYGSALGQSFFPTPKPPKG